MTVNIIPSNLMDERVQQILNDREVCINNICIYSLFMFSVHFYMLYLDGGD